MTIGIDASRAVKEQKTGTEHYSQQIIKALADIDQKNQYLLYSPRRPAESFARTLGKNFTWKVMPFPRLWSQLRLSWEILTAAEKPTVIFEPAHTIPLVHTKNMVATIHDLGFLRFPELYTPFERKYHSFSAWFSARFAKHIIAVSEYTKKDIIKNYGTEPGKITIIYHGFDAKAFKPAAKNQPQIILPFGVKKPYIYFIGRLEHKKNLSGMLATYRILKKNPRFKRQLVLAGKPGWGYEQAIAKKIDGVIETGYLDQSTHALLLKNADIFFFPSLFEGFGMPLVEAFACGVPVVTSDVTSMPEVAGDAGILVNPRQPKEMAKVIEDLIKNPKLRQKLVEKGLKRAKQFSWEKAARETLGVLKNVAMSTDI